MKFAEATFGLNDGPNKTPNAALPEMTENLRRADNTEAD